jgi:MFS transporter, DHA1 family, multidrug resistance protein
MNRRLFSVLSLCSLIPWWIGSGLMPLLPLYAARLGASPALVGSYLSFIFLALAVGTVVGGWLAARVRRYGELLVLVGVISVPVTWLMGHVTHVWQLILLNATLWFGSGITLALVAIIAGQRAAGHERGRIFGVLAMTSALGGVLGGPSGIIVDRWGYSVLFALAASISLGQIGAALFLQNPTTLDLTPRPAQTTGDTPRLAAAFWLLLVAALLFSSGGFAGTLARSLVMEAQGFSGAVITWTAALGSGIGLILNPLFGHLSDHINRRWLLCFIYLAGGLALVVTAYADSLLDFVLVAALIAVSGTERAISTALLSDYLPPTALSRGLSLFDAIKWIGGVVGLSGASYLILFFGLQHALLISAGLPLLASALLLRGRTPAAEPAATPPAAMWQVRSADSAV